MTTFAFSSYRYTVHIFFGGTDRDFNSDSKKPRVIGEQDLSEIQYSRGGDGICVTKNTNFLMFHKKLVSVCICSAWMYSCIMCNGAWYICTVLNAKELFTRTIYIFFVFFCFLADRRDRPPLVSYFIFHTVHIQYFTTDPAILRIYCEHVV